MRVHVYRMMENGVVLGTKIYMGKGEINSVNGSLYFKPDADFPDDQLTGFGHHPVMIDIRGKTIIATGFKPSTQLPLAITLTQWEVVPAPVEVVKYVTRAIAPHDRIYLAFDEGRGKIVGPFKSPEGAIGFEVGMLHASQVVSPDQKNQAIRFLGRFIGPKAEKQAIEHIIKEGITTNPDLIVRVDPNKIKDEL